MSGCPALAQGPVLNATPCHQGHLVTVLRCSHVIHLGFLVDHDNALIRLQKKCIPMQVNGNQLYKLPLTDAISPSLEAVYEPELLGFQDLPNAAERGRLGSASCSLCGL